MATRTVIRANVRTELQEPTEGFWLNTEFDRWINRGYSDLIKAMRVEAVATNVLVAGTESYGLPTDFYLARRVELQVEAGSTNWAELRSLSLDFRAPSDLVNPVGGAPYGYFIFRNALYFVPPPDAAYSSTLYYFKNATPLAADGDSPSYPEGASAEDFDDALVMYVCAQALRKRQDSSYLTYAGDFNAARSELVRDAGSRGSAAPLMVSDDWAGE